jgi:urea carboxylase
MFETVLCSNRGEIAVRIFRTLRRLGIRSVAVYSDADTDSLHVSAADAAFPLGGSSAAESYLDIAKIIRAAKASGAQAILPGYGFLSESAEFAEAVIAAGIVFVGPTPEQLRQFGLKHLACAIATKAKVPTAGGGGLLENCDAAAAAASAMGYPVMLKSTVRHPARGRSRCVHRLSLRVLPRGCRLAVVE